MEWATVSNSALILGTSIPNSHFEQSLVIYTIPPPPSQDDFLVFVIENTNRNLAWLEISQGTWTNLHHEQLDPLEWTDCGWELSLNFVQVIALQNLKVSKIIADFNVITQKRTFVDIGGIFKLTWWACYQYVVWCHLLQGAYTAAVRHWG